VIDFPSKKSSTNHSLSLRSSIVQRGRQGKEGDKLIINSYYLCELRREIVVYVCYEYNQNMAPNSLFCIIGTYQYFRTKEVIFNINWLLFYL